MGKLGGMTANELRIGNWVGFNYNTDRYGRVVDIHQSGVLAIKSEFTDDSGNPISGITTDAEFVFGIPLTPEILEKAGFKRHRCGISAADMWQGMDGWSIVNPFFEGWLFRGDGYRLKLVRYYNSDIRYLHQLQNLYFDLTGEELQIEL